MSEIWNRIGGVIVESFDEEPPDAMLTFHEAAHLSADDVLRLELTLQRRVLRLFLRRGLLDEHTVEDMLTWQASGGFSLDASVRIHGSDATGRERLLSTAPGRLSPLSACASSVAARGPGNTPSPPHRATTASAWSSTFPRVPPATAAPSSPSRPSSFSPR